MSVTRTSDCEALNWLIAATNQSLLLRTMVCHNVILTGLGAAANAWSPQADGSTTLVLGFWAVPVVPPPQEAATSTSARPSAVTPGPRW